MLYRDLTKKCLSNNVKDVASNLIVSMYVLRHVQPDLLKNSRFQNLTRRYV
jgi:hypothetical protein